MNLVGFSLNLPFGSKIFLSNNLLIFFFSFPLESKGFFIKQFIEFFPQLLVKIRKFFIKQSIRFGFQFFTELENFLLTLEADFFSLTSSYKKEVFSTTCCSSSSLRCFSMKLFFYLNFYNFQDIGFLFRLPLGQEVFY